MDTSEIWIERAHCLGEKKRAQERQIRYFEKLQETERNFLIFEDFSKEPLASERKNGKKYLKIERMVRFLT